MNRIFLIVALAGTVVAAAGASAGAGRVSTFPVELAAQNLEPLSGASYELWVIDGGRKLSAGKFNVNRAGRPVGRLVSPIDVATADQVAVTIEPARDRSRGPTAAVVLAGKPRAGRAALRFPVDLRRLAGTVLLATPTDGEGTNETAGIWFLEAGAGGMRPSLQLPALPKAGWIWEGWAVVENQPLTSGRFRSSSGADRASPFSGPTPGPPFPGEDYLRRLPSGVTAPANLADGDSMVVLTIEPDLNGADPTGAGPFSIKPLAVRIPAGTADHKSIRLSRDLSTVPSATVRSSR
jgi:hypothetical protein